MTDSQSALSEVPTLLEERRRYESWLVALEGRRESTPQHVFERVQTDYRTRLHRVAERLASFRDAIAEERTNLQSRLSFLEAEEGLRRDERAELELRSHVGELIGVDAQTAFSAIDQALRQLVSERQELIERIGELGTLLTESAIQSAARNPPGKNTITQAAPVAAARIAAHFDAPAPQRVPRQESLPQVPQAASKLPVAVEESVEPVRPPVAAPTPPKTQAPPPPPLATSGAGPSGPSQVPPRPRGPSPSFGELGFLSSVVGKNDGGPRKDTDPAQTHLDGPLVERQNTEPLIKTPVGSVQEQNTGESLLAGIEKARQTGEPLASVPSNTPIVLRPSTTLEQARTLKCNDCGGMNYPTEWYCERCGAELAAL